MKKLESSDYQSIVNLARKYGIVPEEIKISTTRNEKYIFLVKLQEKTSEIAFLTFQSKLSKLLGDEDEVIDIVTEEILEKRVKTYKMTERQKTQLLDNAQALISYLNVNLLPPLTTNNTQNYSTTPVSAPLPKKETVINKQTQMGETDVVDSSMLQTFLHKDKQQQIAILELLANLAGFDIDVHLKPEMNPIHSLSPSPTVPGVK